MNASNYTPEVLFCDIDGTLVHYPKEFHEYAEIVSENEVEKIAKIRYTQTGEERECLVLSSLTGGNSYISKTTLDLISQLRQLGLCFVLITGARTSTYLDRRPLLPEADFEFFENGGRKLHRGVLDPTWTDNLHSATGPIANGTEILPSLPPPEDRTGTLWDLYRILKAEGWHLDARDYTTNFRVYIDNGKNEADFKKSVIPLIKPRGLATSFNLGKADIYPQRSGKANAARHVLELNGWTSQQAIAMFDDDNDIELAELCGRAFLPGVTHPNVRQALQENSSWTLTDRRGFLGTESALRAIIALRKDTIVPGLKTASAGQTEELQRTNSV